MDFFEHQQRARRRSVVLILLFLAATVVIIAAVDAVVLIALVGKGAAEAESLTDWVSQHRSIVAYTSLAMAALIGFGTLQKLVELRGGGGVVARGLGGTLVTADRKEPELRRLRNVVEEMAIAAGTPVPEVYVLSGEEGINAFAAGNTPFDAAIGVTQGAIQQLRRDELQGVIAHEFSHILNGDMRLNLRLLGVIHGILLLQSLGSRMWPRYRIHRSTAAGLVTVSLALQALGSIGALFARVIKAAISRQREFLADALAVEFTRQPEGLQHALLRIRGWDPGTRVLDPGAEEVSHMLFGSGTRSFTRLLSTHPPLDDRIRAIDPSWRASHRVNLPPAGADLDDEDALFAVAPGHWPREPHTVGIDPARLRARVGAITPTSLAFATAALQALPEALDEAARRARTAPAVICALLLDSDPNTLSKQLASIERALGRDALMVVEICLPLIRELGPGCRIPLLQIASSALRSAEFEESARLRALADELVRADGRVDVLEFAFETVLAAQLAGPEKKRASLSLSDCRTEVDVVLTALAAVGHTDPVDAHAARDAAWSRLPFARQPDWDANGWPRALRGSLEKLGALHPAARPLLLDALVTAAQHDGQVTIGEWDLLRAVAARLQCPIPARTET